MKRALIIAAIVTTLLTGATAVALQLGRLPDSSIADLPPYDR